ncbi:MAG: hypothetical protein VKK62_07585 [Synechococcaceae cyanobacterium]|nr:hypothetical protein [Synechococcaceae cyanobacterium]
MSSGRGTQGLLAKTSLRARLKARPDCAPRLGLDAQAGPPLEPQTTHRNPLQRRRASGVGMPETERPLAALEALAVP